MKGRYAIYTVLGLAGVTLLAWLLRGAAQTLIIVPLARFAWLVKGYYGAFPQAAYWVIALIAAGILSFFTLRLPEIGKSQHDKGWTPLPGPVRDLSFWIQRSRDGIFPKWHVAHLLAGLALEILNKQGMREKTGRQIKDPDWIPPAEVGKYINAGLSNNFTDIQRPRRFGRQPATPFDQDLEPIIEYLESLLENDHDPHP